MSTDQRIDNAVLITGVGKRLGYEMAEHFINKGFRVVGTYRSPRAEVETLTKFGALLYQCDFYNNRDVESFLVNVIERCSSIRAIIHNASDWLPDDKDENAFDKMMQVHAKVPYTINLALESLLLKSADTHSTIINITDYVVDTGSSNHIAYAASKSALSNLTKSFARRLAPHTTVNAIAPGLVIFNDGDSDEYKTKTLEKSLMKKEGGVADFLSVVDWLFETHYVTGRDIPFDGGRHLAK